MFIKLKDSKKYVFLAKSKVEISHATKNMCVARFFPKLWV